MKKSVHTHEQKVLEELLRRIRKEAGLTQTALAARLERHQTFVSKYEKGETMLDLPELRQICAALGMDLPEFVRRYEDALRSVVGE